MIKRHFPLCITITMVVLAILFCIDTGSAAPAVHNIDTGENFETIQAAIEDPDTLNGHTIEVEPFTFHENVVINKSLTITGVLDSVKPVIDADHCGTPVIISANNVILQGFNITGSENSYPGIEVTSRSNVIKSNEVTNNGINFELGFGVGILLDGASGTTVMDNYVHRNAGTGIILDSVTGSTIAGNIIEENFGDGISLRSSTGNSIEDNTIGLSMYGAISGTTYISSGIGLIDCSGNNLSGNVITENDYGFHLIRSDENEFFENTVIGNPTTSNFYSDAILMEISSKNSVRGNDFSSTIIEILYSSDENVIFNNSIDTMCIEESTDNIVYLNDIISVISHASGSRWYSPDSFTYIYIGNTFTEYLGNHYGDYTGIDTNIPPNGIGNIPYEISLTTDYDSYPLIDSYSIYELSNVRGDLNDNGKVDLGDVVKVAYIALGLENQDLRGDFNGNKYVDVGDAAKIRYYYLKLIDYL